MSKILNGIDLETFLGQWQEETNETLADVCTALGLDGEKQEVRNAASSYASRIRKLSPEIAETMATKKRGRTSELNADSVLAALAKIG